MRSPQDSVRDGRALELFAAVCDLTPDVRGRLLDTACGRDENLRAKVEALLARDAEENDGLSERELTLHRVNLAPLFDSHKPVAAGPGATAPSVRAYRSDAAVAGGVRDGQGAWSRDGRLAFSTDGSTVYAVLVDGSIASWDFATAKPKEALAEHGPYVELSQECGGKFAAMTTDGRIVLWDVSGPAPSLIEERRLDDDVSHLALGTDGTVLASGPRLHTATTAEVRKLDERTGFTWSTLLANGDVLAMLDRKRLVRYANDRPSSECALFALQLTVAPDATMIAFCDASTDLYVLDAKSLVVSAVLPGHPDGITTCAFDPSGSRVVAGSPRCLRVLHVGSGNELAQLALNTRADGSAPLSGVRFDPSGELVVASQGGGLFAWRVVEA